VRLCTLSVSVLGSGLGSACVVIGRGLLARVWLIRVATVL